MPTLPDYPGLSWIQTLSPGLSYGLNLPDKKESVQSTFFTHFCIVVELAELLITFNDCVFGIEKVKLVISRISIYVGWNLCCSSEKERPLPVPEPEILSAPPYPFSLVSPCLINYYDQGAQSSRLSNFKVCKSIKRFPEEDNFPAIYTFFTAFKHLESTFNLPCLGFGHP